MGAYSLPLRERMESSQQGQTGGSVGRSQPVQTAGSGRPQGGDVTITVGQPRGYYNPWRAPYLDEAQQGLGQQELGQQELRPQQSGPIGGGAGGRGPIEAETVGRWLGNLPPPGERFAVRPGPRYEDELTRGQLGYLRREGLIQEYSPSAGAGTGGRARYFELTPSGATRQVSLYGR